MSGVKVIRYLLANNASLIAVVPATKIMAGVIPEKTGLPAIAINSISTIRRQHLKKGATEYCTSRVQVTVMAKNYPSQQAILALVRGALPRTRGTVNGVDVDNILADTEGPDFRDDDIGSFMGSLDFIVTFNE